MRKSIRLTYGALTILFIAVFSIRGFFIWTEFNAHLNHTQLRLRHDIQSLANEIDALSIGQKLLLQKASDQLFQKPYQLRQNRILSHKNFLKITTEFSELGLKEVQWRDSHHNLQCLNISDESTCSELENAVDGTRSLIKLTLPSLSGDGLVGLFKTPSPVLSQPLVQDSVQIMNVPPKETWPSTFAPLSQRKIAFFLSFFGISDLGEIQEYASPKNLLLSIKGQASLDEALRNWRLASRVSTFLMLLVFVLMAFGTFFFFKRKERLETLRAQSIASGRLTEIGQMAGGIAHEVNNPLMVILAVSERIKRVAADLKEPHTIQINEGMEKIASSVSRVAQIIRALRQLAHNGSSDPMEAVSSSSVIQIATDICSARFKNNGIDLRVVGSLDAPIYGRKVQLAQVVLNLLNNSLDAVKGLKESWIQIETRPTGDWIDISITDSGSGIDPKIVNLMMTPFYTTKGVSKGTGLGLSIAESIVHEHGGKLFYDDKCPNTRFVIRLKRATDSITRATFGTQPLSEDETEGLTHTPSR